MIYLQLFFSYLKIGFFGFGGGYAMLSLIQHEIVIRHAWITNGQLSDIIAISQMTPGPIAINCATYVGYTVTGNVWGSLLATTAVSIPPLTVMLLICYWYRKIQGDAFINRILSWIKPAVTGMIGAAALMLVTRENFIDWKSFVIFSGCFIAVWKKLNPFLVILVAAIAGIALYAF